MSDAPLAYARSGVAGFLHDFGYRNLVGPHQDVNISPYSAVAGMLAGHQRAA